MIRAAVRQVVPRNRRYDSMVQPKPVHGLRDVARLVGIERRGMSFGYGAIAAASGAFVAHDDKGRCAARIAFSLVGALGLLTHGVQVEVGQHVLHRAYPGIGPQGNSQPGRSVCSQPGAGRKVELVGKGLHKAV